MHGLLARADKTSLFYAYTRVCSFFTVSSLATGVPLHPICHTLIQNEFDGTKTISLLSSTRDFVYAVCIEIKDKERNGECPPSL